MRIRSSIALIILGAFLLAAGLALNWVSEFLAPAHLRRLVLAEFGKSVDATLEVQSVSLDLPDMVHVGKVSLTAPSGGKPVFECDRINVNLQPLSLLTGKVVPTSVTLVSPTVRLTYSADENKWNVESIKSRREHKGEGAGLPPGMLQQGVMLENATVIVSDSKLFGDIGARTYKGFYARMTPDSSGLWHFEGGSLRGAMGGLRITGWFAPGKPPQLNVRFTNDAISVDRQVWHSMPYGPAIWDDFQPVGTMAVSGQVSLDKAGKLLYYIEARLRDSAGQSKYYPFPAHSVSGTVVATNDGIVLKDISGIIRASDLGARDAGTELANFSLNGSENHDNGGYLYSMQASDVPLTRQAIEAVPHVGKEIWQRIQPGAGTCRIALTLSRPRRGAQGRVRAEVSLRGAELHPAEVPMPLQQVNGTVVVDNDAVQFQNLSGIMQQTLPGGASAAHFRVQGLADLHRKESSLDVTLDNVHSTEALVKAIPHHGDTIWRIAQPQVALDARLLVENDADGNLTVHNALLDVHGGQGQLEFWPLPVHDLNGTLKLSGSQLLIERLGGNLQLANTWDKSLPANTRVSAEGVVDLKTNHARVHVSGSDVLLGEELLRSIPVVGARIWEEARPAGMGTIDGQIVYDAGEKEPFHCFLDLGLQDVSLLTKMMKAPLSAVAGHFLVMDDQAFSNGFSGLVCGGHFNARAVVYYGPEDKYPRYSATGSFEKVDVARLAEALTGSDQGIVGQLSGSVDLGGVYGGPDGSMGFDGHVSLSNGHLMKVPLFAQLLNVLRLNLPGQNRADQQGDVAFRRVGDKINIEDFEFTGGGLSLTGKGTIGLDGSLNLTLIAVGAPTKGGIPIISTVVDWLLSNIERQLVRVEVTGTLSKPEYSSTVLSTITWPLRSLRSLLFTPILGGGSSAPESGQ